MSSEPRTYFIKTYGCQANEADSERVRAAFGARGYEVAEKMEEADEVVINTCMVREAAENRVYGLVNNLERLRQKTGKPKKIVVMGCMVGMGVRDKTGKMMARWRGIMPAVDEWLPVEEVGFDWEPVRGERRQALVPISNGCNNFCSFCVVPFTRGREVSRPFEEIIGEVRRAVEGGCDGVMLLGQNVNSYGADLVKSARSGGYKLPDGRRVEPVVVKHLGRYRIGTLFPYLLEEVCKVGGIKRVNFMSSNPWDFSLQLIEVIAKNPKISREIHLPVQSGSNRVLERMKRWYTREEYLDLARQIKEEVKGVELTTDIIVGFPGETEEDFEETVDLVRRVGFKRAYVARYSVRPMAAAGKELVDDVPAAEKKRRWKMLEEMINK